MSGPTIQHLLNNLFGEDRSSGPLLAMEADEHASNLRGAVRRMVEESPHATFFPDDPSAEGVSEEERRRFARTVVNGSSKTHLFVVIVESLDRFREVMPPEVISRTTPVRVKPPLAS